MAAARTRSNAVLHARGCVAMKTGFFDNIFSNAMVDLCSLEEVLMFQGYFNYHVGTTEWWNRDWFNTSKESKGAVRNC